MVEFGACFWAHGATWPEMRDAAIAAETAGFDSIWTDDHLVNDMGDADIPVFEGWTTLAGWAVITRRPRLGLLVGAAPLRDPGLLAKSAITVDHISGGRVTLGLGSGWFAPEYERFGIAFGDGDERADRLDELTTVVRSLVDGERVTHHGRHYDLVDALAEPRPIQVRLPILIGGSGPRRTLGRSPASPTSGTCRMARPRSSSSVTRSCAGMPRPSGGTSRRSRGRSSRTGQFATMRPPRELRFSRGRSGFRERSWTRRSSVTRVPWQMVSCPTSRPL